MIILFNAHQNSTLYTHYQSSGFKWLFRPVQLCLKVLPAGTQSLKSPCQLPVDALRVSMAAGHLNRFDMPAAQGQVCLSVL